MGVMVISFIKICGGFGGDSSLDCGGFIVIIKTFHIVPKPL